MTMSSTIRSLRNLFILVFVIGSLTTACKKNGGSGSDPDPRDQYVGTYSGTYRNTIYFAEDIYGSPQSDSAMISITKGSNPEEIYIDMTLNQGRLGPHMLKVTAKLTGMNFMVVDKNTDTIPIGNPVNADYTASGVFDPNTKQFSYSSVSRGLRNGAAYKQTYEIVATKK